MWSDAELDRLCPLPPDADALPRVVGRAEALERGISRQAIGRRLANGQWRRVLPHTYLTVDTLTAQDRLAAALCFAGAGAALSGPAALYAEQVRRISMPTTVLVLVPPANRVESVAWVQVRRTFRTTAIRQWSGPRRVEVARAAADAALAMRRLDDVRTLVARVVQDRHCTIDELRAELAAGPRQGSKHLRLALDEVAGGAASAPEARAARILRAAGISGFRQNVALRLPDGSTRVVDFYWAELRACLEIDSVEYHFDRAQWAGTWSRHLELTSAGYSVIHQPPSALADPRRFAEDVRRFLAGRAADLARGRD